MCGVALAASRRVYYISRETERSIRFFGNIIMSSGVSSPEATTPPVGMTPKPVGRLVDSSQADDRRLIRLVRERRLLYARNNMPVASYYAQVKSLWDEIATEMGWSVPEVRRKWSHVRNSYSRHLRNQLGGARTGRGRAVSRWHLADELEFLREHMATDTRTIPWNPSQDEAGGVSSAGMLWVTEADGEMKSVWHAPSPEAPPVYCDVKIEPAPAQEDTHSFSSDENSAFFQFFRGIHDDYRGLTERRQRQFRRQCLEILHKLLDEQEVMSAPNAILPDD